MTRGPLPKKAIAAAQEIAASRGTVLDLPELAETRQDFVLFRPDCTVFVRIKRIRTRITNPEEIGRMFRDDVLLSRNIPLTPTVSRQIWTLSPWGRWQYFAILNDRIIGVRRDGTPVLPAAADAGSGPARAGVSPAHAGTGVPSNPPTVAPG